MSAEDWQWCGFAHHFIAADSCRFSLATWVAGGRFMVSTVGDYRRDGVQHTLGSGEDSFFETMVFECDPEQVSHEGHPVVLTWSEDACERYATPELATAGHLALCRTYDFKEYPLLPSIGTGSGEYGASPPPRAESP